MGKKPHLGGRPPVPENVPIADIQPDDDLSHIEPRKFTIKEFASLPPKEMAQHVYRMYERYAEGEPWEGVVLKSYGFTHWRWLRFMEANPQFYVLRNRAKEILAERYVHETREIADEGKNDWMTNRYGDKLVDKEAVCRSQLRMNQRLRAANLLLSQRKFIFDSELELKQRLKVLMTKFGEGVIDNDQVMAFLKAFETEASISEKYDWLRRLEALEKNNTKK